MTFLKMSEATCYPFDQLLFKTIFLRTSDLLIPTNVWVPGAMEKPLSLIEGASPG